MYGLVTGISEAMTPAGFAYFTISLSGISSMIPMLFCRSASRRMPSTFARRRGSGLPMPLSSTLICASLMAVASLPPAQATARHNLSTAAWSYVSTARMAAFARASSVCATACSSGVIVRVGAAATATSVSVLARRDAVVPYRDLDAHRLLARVLLEHLGAQPRDTPDDEQQLADHRRQAEVDQDGGERAVDVQRDRFEALADRRFERAGEADAVAGQAGILGEREQHVHARIDCRVHAVAEPRQPRPRTLRLVDRLGRGGVERQAVAPRTIEARCNQLHAARAGAAVLVADREHAGGNGGRERLPVARRGETGCRA